MNTIRIPAFAATAVALCLASTLSGCGAKDTLNDLANELKNHAQQQNLNGQDSPKSDTETLKLNDSEYGPSTTAMNVFSLQRPSDDSASKRFTLDAEADGNYRIQVDQVAVQGNCELEKVETVFEWAELGSDGQELTKQTVESGTILKKGEVLAIAKSKTYQLMLTLKNIKSCENVSVGFTLRPTSDAPTPPPSPSPTPDLKIEDFEGSWIASYGQVRYANGTSSAANDVRVTLTKTSYGYWTIDGGFYSSSNGYSTVYAFYKAYTELHPRESSLQSKCWSSGMQYIETGRITGNQLKLTRNLDLNCSDRPGSLELTQQSDGSLRVKLIDSRSNDGSTAEAVLRKR